VEQLENLGIDIPPAVTTCEWLTPWGVLFRYDADPDALDRDGSLAVATAAVELAGRYVSA
jgi:hypothetical protein